MSDLVRVSSSPQRSLVTLDLVVTGSDGFADRAYVTLDYREALDVVADVLDHLPRHLVDDLIADLAR